MQDPDWKAAKGRVRNDDTKQSRTVSKGMKEG